MEIKQRTERMSGISARRKAKQLIALTLAVIVASPAAGYGAETGEETETSTYIEALADVAGLDDAISAPAFEGGELPPAETTTGSVSGANIDQAVEADTYIGDSDISKLDILPLRIAPPVVESPVSIGGAAVESSDWYALTDSDGVVTVEGASADNWNVHVQIGETTATVTLKDATVINTEVAHAVSVNGYDLDIVLEGTNNQIGTDKNAYGYGVYSGSGGDVSISGSGDLTLKGGYGININGVPGDVSIDIEGALKMESKWQMVFTGGNLAVRAKSINLEGYYVICDEASLAATDGDVVVVGHGDEGIRYGSASGKNLTISAPQGSVSLSAGKYAVYGDEYKSANISAKYDVSITGVVKSGEVSISSETGGIIINSVYEAISNARTSVSLSAPLGDVNLRTSNMYDNIISGNGYELTVIAGEILDVQSANGISGYGTADIKAQSVRAAITGEGYAFVGGALSISSPEGDNCTEVYVSGGGGRRNVLMASNLTVRADRVTVVSDASAESAIRTTGNVTIGDAGMIVGSISVGGVNNISENILRVDKNGGDVSTSGLNLKVAPEQITYYSAGSGYALFTPAHDPAHDENLDTLLLHGAVIETNANLDTPISLGSDTLIKLEGENSIENVYADRGVGIRAIASSGEEQALIFESGSGASLDVSAWQCTNAGDMTISGGRVNMNGEVYGICSQDNLIIQNGAQVFAKGGESGAAIMLDNFNPEADRCDLTVKGGSTLEFDGELSIAGDIWIYGDSKLKIDGWDSLYPKGAINIEDGSELENNGRIMITKPDMTPEQIKAMKLTGTGVVKVVIEGDEKEGPPEWRTFTNDGTPLNTVSESLDVEDSGQEDKTVADDGYAWDSESKTLTLGNVLVEGNIILPGGSTVRTDAGAAVLGIIQSSEGSALDITFTGSALLRIDGGISGGINGDTINVQSGAQVNVNGSIFLGGSGGQGGTLNVDGAGTTMNIQSGMAYGVMCDTINIRNGASLVSRASGSDTRGVMALRGGVHITGGSTLDAGCDYGVYIIGGKLELDDTSRLITNGSVAPFCIVDKTSARDQSEVLQLPGVPSGTEIKSVTGEIATYWSLVDAAGSLRVSDENSEPVTLTGAKTGKLSFFKAVAPAPDEDKPDEDKPDEDKPDEDKPDGSNPGNSSGGGGSSSGDSSDESFTAKLKSGNIMDGPVIAVVNAEANVKGSHAVVVITDAMVKSAIEKAQYEAELQKKTANGIGAEVHVNAPGAKSITVITEREALNRLVSNYLKLFNITGLPVHFSFDQDSLKQQQNKGTGDIKLVIEPYNDKNFSSAYEISLSTLKKGKLVSINSVDKGTVTVSIPYTPAQNESAGGLYGAYVDENGNINRIQGSAYDKASGCVIFATAHFSKYGVGYSAPSERFTDISSHWAKESIEYVADRGLVSGSSETTFSPGSAATRGTLVMALGRLAQVDTSAYTGNQFTDVSSEKEYCPYIEWAYSKGIIKGIGNGRFAPEKAITREEIAVIFANYANVIGDTLPDSRKFEAYLDDSLIGNNYRYAIKSMQQAGIMTGSENRFNPKGNTTQAELSSIIHRYIKFVTKGEI